MPACPLPWVQCLLALCKSCQLLWWGTFLGPRGHDDKGTGVCGTQVGAGCELRGVMFSVSPLEIRLAADSGPRAPHNATSVVNPDLSASSWGAQEMARTCGCQPLVPEALHIASHSFTTTPGPSNEEHSCFMNQSPDG